MLQCSITIVYLICHPTVHSNLPVPDLPALRILEVTEVQDLSAGVRVPDLERFMTVLHPSSAAEASFGPPGTYRLNPLSSKIRFKKFQKIVFNMSLTINII